ncbi:LysM peptidoglycan-binding domain-containing protein [Pyxidicoccus sp. MSG2]|uniref:LysM peptidoglycan-binding domain-containing protein n=1 Tax=Pyxidicoccus sp. MSG2 TaxID=2996790 RepID=UPI002270763B|nr:LysM domain-containing protein [Pyxidicoccus sp. MSG2]MCY1023395.1 LysM domain-containing protein [Pyxidicoccus sp. MSG2]
MGNTIPPNPGADAVRLSAELAARQAEEAARREALKRAMEQAAPARVPVRPQGQLDGFTGEAARTPVALDGGAGTPPATNLFTEDIRDGQRNCLDAAGDYLTMLPPAQRGRSELVLLDDRRPGMPGHAVIRQGDSLFDPLSGQRYASLEALNASTGGEYRIGGAVNGMDALKILNAPPGSAEREAAIARSGLPEGSAGMLVAQDTAGTGTPTATATATVTPTATSAPAKYTVVVGDDSAEIIAEKLDVSVGALRAENPDADGLFPDRKGYIVVGQKLNIPTAPPQALPFAPNGIVDPDTAQSIVKTANDSISVYGEGQSEETKYNGKCLEYVAIVTGQVLGWETNDPILSERSAAFALEAALVEGVLYSDFNNVPEGTVVFWPPTEANQGEGHAAIVIGKQGDDYLLLTTTGFGELKDDGTYEINGVQEMTLSELNELETVNATGWFVPQASGTETPTPTGAVAPTPQG